MSCFRNFARYKMQTVREDDDKTGTQLTTKQKQAIHQNISDKDIHRVC